MTISSSTKCLLDSNVLIYGSIPSSVFASKAIEIFNQDKFVIYEALVDSGADLCIFHADLAPILGIDLKSGEKIPLGGITGDGMAYVHPVEFKVRGDRYKTLCAFSEDITDYGYGILGHVGFFDHFRVKFEYDIKNIELVPTNRR